MPVIGAIAIFEGASALVAGGLTAFETVAAVGSIVGGVGAVTGNKDMMKVGAVAGLAGGLGAYAQGQGWIASDGPMGDTSSNITAMKNARAPVSDVNPTDMRLADGTQGSPGMAQGSQPDAITRAIGEQPSVQTGGLMTAQNPTAGAATTPLASTNTLAAPTDATNPDINAKDMLLARGDVTSPLGSPAGSTSGAGFMSMFKDFSDWTNEHKGLTSVLGNFIGGAFDAKKKAEADLLGSQSNYYKQLTANMTSAPDMNFRNSGPVTFPGASPTYRAPTIGLYGAKG